jgi:hypothetical protein
MPGYSRRLFVVPIHNLFSVISVSLILLAISLVAPSDASAQVLTKPVTLTWTATGDNGFYGRAAKYDFRYSARQITYADTLTWWKSAAVVNMTSHVPPPSGAKDSIVVAGLVVGMKYYAILRIADSAGNWSGYSNVAVMDLSRGITAVEEVALGNAPALVVGAPYPSPTRGRAQVSLTLARSGPVSADIFDARGRLVRTLHAGTMEAGPHVLRWDGASESGAQAATGVYWIRVASEEVRKTVKLVVVR